METPVITNELQLQAACATWFWNEYRYTRFKYALHMNDNNSFDKREGSKKKAMGVREGISDLELITPGVVYYIELKWKDGTQSAEQKEFQAMCLEFGHPYLIIRTFEKFKQTIWKLIGK